MLVAAACLISSTANADDLYLPMMHILTTKGTYEKNTVTGGDPNGMSRAECELRLEAWKLKFGASMDMAADQLRKQGGSTSYRLSCDRI